MPPLTPKQAVRRDRRSRRRQIVATRDLERDAAMLADHLAGVVDELGLVAGDAVTAYESLPLEPPTGEVCRLLTGRGMRVLVPVTLPSFDLDWVDLADPRRSTLGIVAVSECRLLLVPGLTADVHGMRLGQAGGCYDRTIPRARSGTPVIVLLHPGEIVDGLPSDPWDVSVHAALTAEGLTRFAPWRSP